MAQLPDSPSPKTSPPVAGAKPSAPRDRPTSILPAGVSPLTLTLTVLSVALLLFVVLLKKQVGSRDQTILEQQNRAAQSEGTRTLVQRQMADERAETERALAQLAEARAETTALEGEVERAKVSAAAMQAELDKSRLATQTFQSQMAESKVAGIRQEGVTELAKTQATVMEAQMNQAKTEVARLQSALDVSRRRTDTLQARVAAVELELANAQKTRSKK